MVEHRGSAAIACVILAVVSHSPRNANAQAPAIKTNPDPVQFGKACEYSIENAPNNASSYLWKYHYVSPVVTNWGPLSDHNTWSTQSVYHTVPGTFKVRCTIGLMGDQQNPNPPPITLTIDVVVPKPDGYTISGKGIDTPLGSDCVITFHVTSGEIPADFIDGFAQEKIRNLKLFDYQGNIYLEPDDTDWVPVNAGAPLADRFKIEFGNIIDKNIIKTITELDIRQRRMARRWKRLIRICESGSVIPVASLTT